MKISQNELTVTATKACLGAKISDGVAIEIGHAMPLLEHDGVVALGELVERLGNYEEGRQSGIEHGLEAETFTGGDPLRDGPMIADAVILAEGKNISVSNIAAPSLLTAMILRIVHASGGGLSVCADGKALPSRDWAVSLRTANPEQMQFSRLADQDKGLAVLSSPHMKVCGGKWKTLKNFANNLLVPADDATRARDAGAGLTDND